MKRISLTRGMLALVDDADFEWLSQWKWFAMESRGKFYAARSVHEPRPSRKCKILYMHKEILGITGTKMEGDHKDGDSLKNTRSNLRSCTHAQNGKNRKIQKGSKYRGIYFHSKRKRWIAQITCDKKQITLGSTFLNPEDALRCYEEAAKKMYGAFYRPQPI